MKQAISLLTAVAILAAPALAFGQSVDASPGSSPGGKHYTCPMHPEVVQDKPGKCPKCGMALEEKKKEEKPKS